jgi:2-dehydro-3-deoxyphosphogluconate aldolase/(4S)-4-hydroxy-2-oxoglutarate aldolase
MTVRETGGGEENMSIKEKWNADPAEVLGAGPVMPVAVIRSAGLAAPLARALLSGGVRVLEITLRTPQALDAIRMVAREVPEVVVGAGTVTTGRQLEEVREAGGAFAISPGLTPALLESAGRGALPLIPGIATVSELMIGLEHGYSHFKFFPAEPSGGVKALRSIGGPLPQAVFCPTGGIGLNNYLDYLALDNVACVGGSWLAPAGALERQDWDTISGLAAEAVAGVEKVP